MASASRCLLVAGCLLGAAHAFSTPAARGGVPERGPAFSGGGAADLQRLAEPQVAASQPEEPSSRLGPLIFGALLGLVVAVTGASQPALADAKAWGYKDPNTEWSADFAACSGKEQSPIDLKASDVSGTASESLASRLSYKPLEKAEIFNNGGKNVQVNGGFGTFKLPDGDYEVKQFHFHFPSEHKVDGKLAAGELHIVHQKKGASGTDGLAVVGIVLDEQGSPDESAPEFKFLKQLGFGTELPGAGSKNQVAEPLDLNNFANEFGGGFKHYTGSLTSPPCAEKVHWYVCNKTVPVSKAMVKTFQARFPENNRPVQPLNVRKLVANEITVPGEF
mmetsp:Transcript_111987/g.281866  ORF Transcript_111987/g.281866 Transcript_111987/m.281866 type:complete len:334 (+) Transcript_111987:75-1076(+)